MKKFMEKLSPTRFCAKLAAKRLVREQRGDTNFISIAIIMIVVIAVAVIFIGFKDDVAKWFGDATDTLEGVLNPKET